MRIVFSFLAILFFLPACLQAQGYRYTRYDVNNGLAGSTVYCMLQDQEGFMWFGTETGVSRFDGTHFKNFGVADGLPDNEILDLFQDSKGRIWMAPFKKSVCYYYKGKIFNRDNDSVLRQIKPQSHILKFAEANNGDILMMEANQLHLVNGTNVKRISSLNNNPTPFFLSISKNLNGGFLVYEGDKLYELRNNQFHLLFTFSTLLKVYKYIVLNEYFLGVRISQEFWTFKNLQTGRTVTIPQHSTFQDMQLLGDSLLFSNNQTGTVVYSLKQSVPTKNFMNNKAVSKSFIDNQGNYWFTTLGEGVFRLASENMTSVEFHTDLGRKLNVFCMKITPHRWVVGADMMQVFEIRHDSGYSVQVKRIWDEWGSNLSSRVMAIDTFKGKKYLFGSDMILQVIPAERGPRQKYESSIKSMFRSAKDELLVATRSNVLSFSLPELLVKDTLWNERSTAVYSRNDTVYVGTLDGLFLVLKDKSGLYAGKDEPLLRNRINVITGTPDGMLWVATNGAGVLGYRNGKIEKKIRIEEGLSSNNCRAIYITSKEMWVGTDKGLHRVIFQPQGYRIVRFTQGDGLSSNEINAIGVDSNLVVIGTPEGVNFFDANRISFESHCSLVMDNIQVSDRNIDPGSRSFTLAHKDNNIKFQYAGISFRSGGEMSYNYRLIGLDTTWKTTSENFLEYPTLPSGEYALQLQAVNKFGIRSEVINVPFVVEKLLTEKTWFRISVSLIVVAIVSLFVAWLLRRVKRRETEKNEIRRKIAELEQMALKSQMNPHFIFNCLNSIQQFVLDKDVEGSNRFITGFSRLIRQTLDISARQEISLSEEITYLSTYLELEKTRFEEKFTFEVKVLDGINPDELYLPPMMLQPFVENSIRHGLRYRADKLGMILVSFNKIDSELICQVEDNGIGRKEALRHKSSNPIEYQSKGMSLIASRVAFLNRDSVREITIKIEDLLGENENAIGTRVMMKFPLEDGLNKPPHD